MTNFRYWNDMVNLDQALSDWPVPFSHIGTASDASVTVNSQRRCTVAPITLISINFNSHLGPLWQAMRIKAFFDVYFYRQERDNSSSDADSPFLYQMHICGVVALIDCKHSFPDSEPKASPGFSPYCIVPMASRHAIYV
jgi:hypothetical protein